MEGLQKLYLLHLNKVMRTLIKKTNYYIFSINRYILYCTAYLTEKQRTYFFRPDVFFTTLRNACYLPESGMNSGE